MYNPVSKDEVLRMVKLKGPLIPIHLKKDLNTDTILIGALLSQLVAEGKVKVTTVKIGGSPTYYAPGGEEGLVGLMRYLNEKDRRTAELLKEKKLLKDSEQDPLIRVCLRNIKDYAKPLAVSIKGTKEIYWKWFLLPTKEAEELISKQLKPKEKPIVSEPNKEEEAPAKKAIEQEKKQELPPARQKEHKEKQQKLKEEKAKEEKPLPSQPAYEKSAGKPKLLLDQEKDAFFGQVRKYLEENGIAILDYKLLKKSEIDLTILVPTPLGAQAYFCKAKNKKRISEGDLASAYLQGQSTKLPIIFLSPGEPGKKLKDQIPTLFKGMVVKKI